jgi:hypothetical protein
MVRSEVIENDLGVQLISPCRLALPWVLVSDPISLQTAFDMGPENSAHLVLYPVQCVQYPSFLKSNYSQMKKTHYNLYTTHNHISSLGPGPKLLTRVTLNICL